MVANVQKRKKLRERQRKRAGPVFRCKKTKRSWQKNNITKKQKLQSLKKKKLNKDNANNNEAKTIEETKVSDSLSYLEKEYHIERDSDAETNSDVDMYELNTKKPENPVVLDMHESPVRAMLDLAVHAEARDIRRFLKTHQVEYLQRLINRYGTNYDTMAKDIKLNFFQFTANKLKREIEFHQHRFVFGQKTKNVL
ncbi:ribosome biogenesis protein Nop16 (predicted) [Reticulomyxa filosa]|uniref:Nucleolar protein 16 n=1 Tax=Reticulomyxa filosa TaxID=46433 RepID=X6PAK6_RETFI|nr:ribosome biogenesis protein Nop16 (predicted) [Reticulomyxa filosa]|eukprot:ETO35094.1 ribosome biogenesis protein Nop16 (predicted) [Reticulomyxa filosa]